LDFGTGAGSIALEPDVPQVAEVERRVIFVRPDVAFVPQDRGVDEFLYDLICNVHIVAQFFAGALGERPIALYVTDESDPLPRFWSRYQL
jgi:hypothetical protein